MDLTTLFYNLREEVSCSVCSDLFTDPKHLSCLHSFCLMCLKRWYDTCGGGQAIKCPKCQTLSRVPASGDLKDLPTSFYLNGLIDVLAIKECKKTQVTCGNCEKKCSEASYCFQCCIFYCEHCLICHNTMRDKKEHRVLALKEFQNKDYEDVLKRPVFCSKERHQKEEVKYYCKDCETALCQTCVTLNHGGHDLRLIEEEAENKTLEIKSILQSQREGLDAKLNVIAQLDEDCAKVIQQSEIARRDVQRFADGLIKTIQAKMKNVITAVENQTKKSLEILKAKRSEIQQQVNATESSLKEADKLLKRSTTAEVVELKKSLQTIFQGLNQTEPIVHDPSSLQTLVFVESQKTIDTVNGGELGFLCMEEGYRKKPSEFLAEGKGLKEGTVGRKAQFNLITRKAKRKQWYDEQDRVKVEIKDEQERECVTQVKIDSNENGIYKITYFPIVPGTFKLLVKVNGENISCSPFTVILKPFQVKPVLSFGKRGGSGEGMFEYPLGVAVSDVDEIAVTEQLNHRVQVFDSNGTLLRSLDDKGENAGEFKCLVGIAIDRNRNILVTDNGNHRVQILSWEGRHLGSFGGKGSLDSQLDHPWGLSLDSAGNVIVADIGNRLIKIFTPDGRFVMKIGGKGSFSFPVHCVQCGEYFIVSDSDEHCIKVFNSEGHFQYKFGKQGQGDGEFKYPRFLSVTQSKHLLVCDMGNHRIQVFELDGKFVGKFGTKGSNLGEFKEPFSVAVLSNDQIVVCEKNSHRIQIFQHR
ncbi:E3 ubiquitin-protein ligase TRIM45-like [Porites lutea]|uniref:E3 ubiquitin-protein ligase TRIM45-like n=1 Tax=Porites lutea TaxID=51062 RepID=UPI003CC645B3